MKFLKTEPKILKIMKLKQFLYLSLFIFTLLIAPACTEDYLELKNPNRVTDEDIKSASGVRQLEIGMYRRIADAYNYFWQLYMSHLPGEYEMKETTGEGPMHQQVWNLNMSPSNVFNAWLYSDYYGSLAIANRIIEYMEANDGAMSALPESEFNLILGGAYFMRAFNHFYLLHSWGRPFDADDVYGIVMHTSIVSERNQFEKPRSKPSEVYLQIEADLKAAEEILVLAKDIPSDQLGRPTRGAATAFLGKVYLFQKKYQLAADKFEQFIIENPEKTLLPYYGDNFNGKFENGPESVFEIQFADLVTTNRWQGGGTGNHYQIYAGGHGMGRDNFGVNPSIVRREDDAEAIPGDLSNFDVRDIRFSETVYSAGPIRKYVFLGDTIAIRDTLFFTNPPQRVRRSAKHTYTPKKYISNHRSASNAGGMATDVSYENQVVMRVAEVYFLYAEALASLNRIPEAAQYLNKTIRRARGYQLDEETPYDFAGTDATAFMQLLMEEKRKEFIGEQIRWYDVIRWGIAESEIARVEDRVAWIDKAASFPIPLREMANNPNMVQNPGY
jgi:starch-binding outer membrane protein, SusD/RagB family